MVWELGGRLVLEIIDVRRSDQLMLSSYIGAWLSGECAVLRRRGSAPAARAPATATGLYTLTWAPALLVLLALTGGLTAAAFAVFRRRDLI